jgi:hypothetical protein
MRENFLCLDCETMGELTKHGRCAKCTSDAVVSVYAHRPQGWPVTQYSQIQELERIAQLL